MNKAIVFTPLLGFLLSTSATYAQDRVQSGHGRVVPSDAELKAAYCIAVVSEQRQELAPALKALSSSSKSESNPAKAKVLARAAQDGQSQLELLEDRISRLSSFLLPRQALLEPRSLLAAINRGKVDYAASDLSVQQCRAMCANAEPQEQCLTDCMAKDDVLSRTLQCNELDFLPY